MCAVSMVSQHYMDKWPDPYQWSRPVYDDYTELMRKAALYDEAMKQKDCQDPIKAAWQRRLDQHMQNKPKDM